MAILHKGQTQSAHWYTRDARPAHTTPAASGDGERTTTIKDARRLGLYPSVTSILSIFSKPGLDTWKMNQVALAARRSPQTEGESDEYWCKRVAGEAFAQVEEAADLGTRIHAALDSAVAGEPFSDDLLVYVRPLIEWKEKTGIEFVEREKCLVNQAEGFAGTCDVLFRYGKSGVGVLDYKTRKTKPGEKVTPYDGQAMQLAAYAATYWGEDSLEEVLAANIYISTTEPGRFEIVKHPNLEKEYDAFKHACAIWRHLRGYDPRDV